MSNNDESGWLVRFEVWEFFLVLKQISFWDLILGRGHFENCIRPFKMDQTCVQMIPNIICDTFQPIIDFYWLDVEI